MDTDELLSQIRAYVNDVRNAYSNEQAANAADQLANLVDTLDDELSKGGRYPDAWQPRSAWEARIRTAESGGL